ncbi:gluzincin family metallopeptidase [Peredibacter starrii]|uniref:Uncharacterized protein n=1 Tax=Peredibacter starrii TaxID=28202 RepID=A0AAX4HSU1_9BACT|nr:hypothetical protein [Peredibacter starrii]WPU66292.1 hypothetical protein SOO65_05985 [Peredibacter starrii]
MKLILMSLLMFWSSVHAYEAQVRKGELSPTLESMLVKANVETGMNFSPSHFLLIEERNLATSRYQFYVQMNSEVPVARTAVRIWSDLKTNELILAEMHLDEATLSNGAQLKAKFNKARFSPSALKSPKLNRHIKKLVAEKVSNNHIDNKIISLKFKDQWVNGDLRREVEVRGLRGLHFVAVSLLKNEIVEYGYREFAQSEMVSLKAHVYPIYEEVEATGERLNYEERELKYISSEIPDGGDEPLSGLGETNFTSDLHSPLLAETSYGQMKGLWSENSVRKKVEDLVSLMPKKENSFNNGVLLQGKYATVNLHPAVKETFKDLGGVSLRPTVYHMMTWMDGEESFESKALSGLSGKLITSQEELLSRTPVRLYNHDVRTYIESGVDEVQVYYGVTVLMDSLVGMGFNDAELSEKPFHAFLYDPDISMKDNAYYYDNTINFTTYSPGSPNYARDNPTIWHELGHAIMERLMGTHLGFADSKGGYGGLSEGMADFIAQIVVEEQTKGASFTGKETFRIINETGFALTNEFHDEGEAYGGVMNDMLMTVIRSEGEAGLRSFANLTIEAMRLTRNHPKLSAASWFEHMLIADELQGGKYKDVIVNALRVRNFSFEREFRPATMKITFHDVELTSDSQGSRERPVMACGTQGEVAFNLKMELTSGDSEFIKFPALVKVEYKKGALQGAINWVGEESNPQSYTVHSEDDILDIPIKANPVCDYINSPDGSCKDYAYIQVFNSGLHKPIAKKRFYLRLNHKACAQ